MVVRLLSKPPLLLLAKDLLAEGTGAAKGSAACAASLDCCCSCVGRNDC